MMYLGETRKNGAFWVPKGTWQGDREAQTWPCPNFPVNEWFLRGKNFHSFVYKPEGVGNPQIILVGTLKDCTKLHKNIQNLPENFGHVYLSLGNSVPFSYETSCQLSTAGCCVTCVIFTKIFYKVIGWATVYNCKLNVFFISVSVGCWVEWGTLRITDTGCVLNVPLTS